MTPTKPSSQLDDAYWSLRSLAAYAGLSVRTIRSYLHHPVSPLPHYRIGGKVLVRKSDYDAWVLRFRQQSAISLSAMVDEVLETIR
jgi:hypothetical protein